MGVAVEASAGERTVASLPTTSQEQEKSHLLATLPAGHAHPVHPQNLAPGKGESLRDPSSLWSPPALSLQLLLSSFRSCCSEGGSHSQPLVPKLAQPRTAEPKNWKADARSGSAGEGRLLQCAPPSGARPGRRQPRPSAGPGAAASPSTAPAPPRPRPPCFPALRSRQQGRARTQLVARWWCCCSLFTVC